MRAGESGSTELEIGGGLDAEHEILARAREAGGTSTLQNASAELGRVLEDGFYRTNDTRRTKNREQEVLRDWAAANNLIVERKPFDIGGEFLVVR